MYLFIIMFLNSIFLFVHLNPRISIFDPFKSNIILSMQHHVLLIFFLIKDEEYYKFLYFQKHKLMHITIQKEKIQYPILLF